MSAAAVRWLALLCGGLLSIGEAWAESQSGERIVGEKTPYYSPGSDGTTAGGEFVAGDRVKVVTTAMVNAKSWAFVRSLDGKREGYVLESALGPVAPPGEERIVHEKTPYYSPGSDGTTAGGEFVAGDRVTVVVTATVNAKSWVFVRSLDGKREGYVLESALGPIAPNEAAQPSSSGDGVVLQWNADHAPVAPWYSEWQKAPEADFPPYLSIEASALAFTPDGKSLYMVLEKSRHLLRFDVGQNTAPVPVRLELPSEFDIEGISILGDQIYLVDEDSLQIYVTSRIQPSPVRYFKADVKKDESETNASGDLHSLEGIVVHSQFLGPKSAALGESAGPFVYLLDERDRAGERFEAKLYVGALRGRTGGQNAASAEDIDLSRGVVKFDLGPIQENFRLSELFEHQGRLYALKTRFSTRPNQREYAVVHCILDPPGLKEVCNLTREAHRRTSDLGESNNYEGAAVAPAGSHFGKLFLTADNAQTGTNSQKLEKANHRTPLIVLPQVRAN